MAPDAELDGVNALLKIIGQEGKRWNILQKRLI
jgi:hypothetical protein